MIKMSLLVNVSINVMQRHFKQKQSKAAGAFSLLPVDEIRVVLLVPYIQKGIILFLCLRFLCFYKNKTGWCHFTMPAFLTLHALFVKTFHDCK